MPATARRTYDHRLRKLVVDAGIAAVNDVELPRSTVASWTKRGLKSVTTSSALEGDEADLRVRLAKAEQALVVLRALLRLLLVLIRVRGARLTDDRMPVGKDKQRIIAAVKRASKTVPRRMALRAVGLTESRFRRWQHREALCVLDDQTTCPKSHPSRLTFDELKTMHELVESHELRHLSIRALATHAKRLGKLFASDTTWFRTILDKGWMRPKQRLHPESPRVGIRASAVGELLHVDVTVIRLVDGTKVFLQAVMDNFSRRILAYRVSPALETWRTADLLKVAVGELRQVKTHAKALMCDSGVENINSTVDDALKETGVERILAQVDVSWSNSLIEAIWRKMKHDWLFINRLESFAIVERLVALYVDQYNRVIPHSALKGRTPDEVFRGEANDLPERLREAHQTAIRDRVAVNKRLSCESCQIASSTNLGSSEIAAPERKVE